MLLHLKMKVQPHILIHIQIHPMVVKPCGSLNKFNTLLSVLQLGSE